MKKIFEKSFFALMPIFFGIFIWQMAWGFGQKLFAGWAVQYQLSLLLRAIIAFGFCLLFFSDSYVKNENVPVSFFNKRIYLIPWWFFIVLSFLALGSSFLFIPLWEHPFVQSIILGLIFSSCIEELVTHSMFQKYSMKWSEFLVFNSINSIAFMLMHAGYVQDNLNFVQLLSNGHIQFSFILGIITFQTRRIEIPIILHLLSNFLRFTVPKFVIAVSYDQLLAVALDILLIVCLVGLKSRKSSPVNHENLTV